MPASARTPAPLSWAARWGRHEAASKGGGTGDWWTASWHNGMAQAAQHVEIERIGARTRRDCHDRRTVNTRIRHSHPVTSRPHAQAMPLPAPLRDAFPQCPLVEGLAWPLVTACADSVCPIAIPVAGPFVHRHLVRLQYSDTALLEPLFCEIRFPHGWRTRVAPSGPYCLLGHSADSALRDLSFSSPRASSGITFFADSTDPEGSKRTGLVGRPIKILWEHSARLDFEICSASGPDEFVQSAWRVGSGSLACPAWQQRRRRPHKVRCHPYGGADRCAIDDQLGGLERRFKWSSACSRGPPSALRTTSPQGGDGSPWLSADGCMCPGWRRSRGASRSFVRHTIEEDYHDDNAAKEIQDNDRVDGICHRLPAKPGFDASRPHASRSRRQ